MERIFSEANILLPKNINIAEEASRWATLACDQFTSEPDYWKGAYNFVGGTSSTINLILPEAFLSECKAETLERISHYMDEYEKNVLEEYKDALILVKRVQSDGRCRLGIVGKIDLEAYDYSVGSNSSVRATEGTVLERIPPRVAVRRGASIELPHIMLLIDDNKKEVIEPVAKAVEKDSPMYDFDLMLGGGHISGYCLGKEEKKQFFLALDMLFTCKNSSIKFAVGDGNHSLATAKARYEEIKQEIGEERAKNHPARYALCEVVNLHDDALSFEPIYRLVKTNDKEKLIAALEEYGRNSASGKQEVVALFGDKEKTISLGKGSHTLTVGTLQKFLDEYDGIEVDYIHGMDSIKKLSDLDDSVGFIFEGMKKEELFASVEKDGALPRKTFSMGEAKDKRYYVECRKITE